MSNWYELARCKGKTELFFAPFGEREQARNERVSKALALCGVCPVRQQCADAKGDSEGIWGGVI